MAPLPAVEFRLSQVTDLGPGESDSFPEMLTVFNDELYFVAEPNGAFRSRGLYRTDGEQVTRLAGVTPAFRDAALPIFNGALYFSRPGPNGDELARTDGQKVVDVADINPGPAGSSPGQFHELSGQLIFTASGPNGRAVYSTDGVSAMEIADVHPGADFIPIDGFKEFGGELYFTAEGPDGNELYKTDGQSVQQVTDIGPGPGGSIVPIPLLLECRSELYFVGSANDNASLYRTDGETVTRVPLGSTDMGYAPSRLTAFKDQLFFSASGPNGVELYKTDGTTVVEVADLQPGLASSLPGDVGPASGNVPFVEYQEELYFNALGPQGSELHRTDGETIAVVADLSPEFFVGTRAADFRVFGGELYFTGNGPSGVDLYKTDGVNVTALDVNPGGAAFHLGDAVRTHYAEFGGQLLFAAIGPHGRGLFATDGTTVSEITVPHRVDPLFFEAAELDGALYFSADGPHGTELYKLTVAVPEPAACILLLLGALVAATHHYTVRLRSLPMFVAVLLTGPAGELSAQRFVVEEVADIVPGLFSSEPFHFTELGGELIFTAHSPEQPRAYMLFKTDGETVVQIGDIPLARHVVPEVFGELSGELYYGGAGPSGEELYKTDGEQIVEVAEIRPGPMGSYIGNFARLGEHLFFSAVGPNGGELFRTDGTEVTEVADIRPGSEHADPQGLTRLGDELVFVATGPDGRELYKTDGTSITQLADIFPGPADAFYPNVALTAFSGRVAFVANGPAGRELFTTDGTEVTALDINPGPGDSSPAHLTRFGDELFFSATGPNGRELYKTDGLTAMEVADLMPGPEGSSPQVPFRDDGTEGTFTEYNGELYFTASGENGMELHKTDGETISQVADLNDTLFGSRPTDLTVFNGELYFVAFGPDGLDLYKTDGTEVDSLDVNPNGAAFMEMGVFESKTQYAEFAGHLFFSADAGNGRELFSTDGVTLTEYDLFPGVTNSIPYGFLHVGDELFFTATGPHGRELYKVSVVPEPASLVSLAVMLLISARYWRRGHD